VAETARGIEHRQRSSANPKIVKRVRYCQLPKPMKITGRSSSITNAFFSAIIPTIEPTEGEELEALRILKIDPKNICCAYCGGKMTEWDHLRPIITNQLPTGYITEIANLVPSCGKCNQSKGRSDWRKWMQSKARLSPKTLGIPDIERRMARLEKYEAWRLPQRKDFAAIAGKKRWRRHIQNWQSVLGSLRKSQELATEIRHLVEKTVNRGRS